MKNKPKFVHLHVHSTYSLLEGAMQIKDIIKKVAADNQPAIAITDTNNLFAALEFSSYAVNNNIQPIIGAQLSLLFEEDSRDKIQDQGVIVVLAKNDQGVKNLLKLVSTSYLGLDGDEAYPHNPKVKIKWLQKYKEGLIILTGGDRGTINLALEEGNEIIAKHRIEELHKIFGDDLYVELQRYEDYNKYVEFNLLKYAKEYNLKIVATNEAFFLAEKDYEAHDALLAIAEGQLISNKNRRRVHKGNYLKTQMEMETLFADLPCALENTVRIAQSCISFVKKHKLTLPRFINTPSEDILTIEANELEKQAKEGLRVRLDNFGLAQGFTEQQYFDRLKYEISIICRMEFPGYFLIVSDFIKWAKNNNIPVGPGRGSGAGSLVAYALSITDIDPLRFSLLFERFLNPDRVSMPDFDIDFCQDRRHEVIKYVQQRYGKEKVAHIITFGSFQARGVLRDVGRVLEIPYRKVDELCKMVPQNPGVNISLEQAIVEEPKFSEESSKDPTIERLLLIAKQLEGLYRHSSTHAAGVVIGDRSLDLLVPLYLDAKSTMPVTQYTMKYVEQAGLVKFDFLGLKTLSVLKKASDFILKKNPNFNLSNISLSDPLTYELLAQGNTLGVFQVESAGMQDALKGMKPDCIEDIIALVALYRPGPMDNIPVYNRRKNGLEKVEYPLPQLESILKETKGVIIYQEQVMQIAQLLAGYSLGEADLLRRAMGKKNHTEMENQRLRFIEGAKLNNISESKAKELFDLLAKFADYGFNKSHAAAYGLISYQTAFLKANYPCEFLAASMTYDMLNTDRINGFRIECERLGIEVIAPNLQYSQRDFAVDGNKIYYSLSAIKGVGDYVAQHIASVRGNKKFTNLQDFCSRVSPKLVNKTVLENLIRSGAFDCFDIARDKLFYNIPAILNYIAIQNDTSDSLFGAVEINKLELRTLPPSAIWKNSFKLQNEFETLGFYVSGHPLQSYGEVYSKSSYQRSFKSAKTTKKSTERPNSQYRYKTFSTCGTLVSKQLKKTKRGDRMHILTFSQPNEQFEAVLFSDIWDKYADIMQIGASMALKFELIEHPERSTRQNVVSVSLLDKANSNVTEISNYNVRYYNKLSLKLEDINNFANFLLYLEQLTIIKNDQNDNRYCNISIKYNSGNTNLHLDLGNRFIICENTYKILEKHKTVSVLEKTQYL